MNGRSLKSISIIFRCCLVITLVLSGGRWALANETYTVGVVPQYEPRETFAIWQPILREIERQSGLYLSLKISSSIPEFEKQFENGKFDFAYMNPYHLLIANESQGYEPLVRDVGRKLYGIIVVKKDSPIKNIRELAGKTVAFPAPNALGAALIPRAELSTIYHTDVIAKYVQSHSSVYLSVILGQSDAGGGVQKTLSQQPKEVQDRLRVIYETSRLAPHPLAIHPRVKKEDRDKVLQVFLKLGQTDAGRALLSKIPIRQVGTASLEDYAPLKEMGLSKFYVRD